MSKNDISQSIDRYNKKNWGGNDFSIFSGRIVVLREGGSNKDTLDTDREEENTNNGATTTTIVKSGCQWIHVAHDSVTPTEVIDLLDFDKPLDNSGSGCVVIKFEPLVLHIQCRDLDAAKLVHTASVEAGFRNSGNYLQYSRLGQCIINYPCPLFTWVIVLHENRLKDCVSENCFLHV